MTTTTEAKLRLKGELNFMIVDIKEYWWEDELLCLIYENGHRHYINKTEIAEFEVSDK